MGKSSNRKKNSTGFASAIVYNCITVYRDEGVNPKYGELVIKAIQAVYQDDLPLAKSRIEALERHGVSIFDFEMGFDSVAFGLPQCVCSWALSTDAREVLSWLIQKAFDRGDAIKLPFALNMLYKIDSYAADSVEFPRIAFAATTLIACYVAGRAQKVLDTIPGDIGPRARAIVINEVSKELARVDQIAIEACITTKEPLDTGKESARKNTIAAGSCRL